MRRMIGVKTHHDGCQAVRDGSRGSRWAETFITASWGVWGRRGTIPTIWYFNQNVFSMYCDGGVNICVNVRVNVSECDGRMELRLSVTDVMRSVTGQMARSELKHPSRRVRASGPDVVR